MAVAIDTTAGTFAAGAPQFLLEANLTSNYMRRIRTRWRRRQTGSDSHSGTTSAETEGGRTTHRRNQLVSGATPATISEG
jgi:hypothetical protein